MAASTMSLMVTTLLLVLLVPCSVGAMNVVRPAPVQTDNGNILCYYINWSQYRPNIGKFVVADIDPFLCTHILYAFAKVEGNTVQAIEWNDFQMYLELNALKNINPNLKTLLSLGGASAGPDPFVAIAENEENRKEFAKNVVSYIRMNGFDGVDIDWEFPTVYNKENFTELLKDLRMAFEMEALSTDAPRLLLACSLSASSNTLRNSYDHPGIDRHVDFAAVMTYDLHGSWDPYTGFHSGLHPYQPGDIFNQEWAINMYLQLGISPEKLVLGIPSYGRTFTLCDEANHDVRDCAMGAGESGPQTNAMGILAYHEICRKIRFGYTREYDSVQQVPYAYFGDQWVGYDDAESVKQKAEFAASKSLGGVMFWDLSVDDFRGLCSDGRFPLIRAAKHAFSEIPINRG